MPGGRPTKLTPLLQAKINHALSCGLTDEETAALVGIDDLTFTRWRKNPAFCRAIKAALAKRLLDRLGRIEMGVDGWQGTAWALERLYPTRFARPEVTLSINNSYTQNNLSINISGQEAKQIESEAKPVRDAVSSMFQKYRPQLNNGNGDAKQHEGT